MLNFLDRARQKLANQNFQTKSHPSYSNDYCKSGQICEKKTKNDGRSSKDDRQENKTNHVEKKEEGSAVDFQNKDKVLNSKIYQGLLFIEELRNVKEHGSSFEYFVTYEGFWNECHERTQTSISLVLNYLKVN